MFPHIGARARRHERHEPEVVDVHPADRERRRDGKPVDAGRRGGGEGIVAGGSLHGFDAHYRHA
jgi:hypothetical protein